MQSFLRLILLGFFSAVGIGVAICLALTLEPAADSPVTQGQTDVAAAPCSGIATAPSAASDEDPGRTDTTPNRPESASSAQVPSDASAAGPVIAPFHPAVAFQVDRLEELAEKARESTDRTDSIMRRALSFLQPPAKNPDTRAAADPDAVDTAPADASANAPNTPAVPIAASQPTEVERGSADDRVDVNSAGTDIRVILDLLGRMGNLNILASANVQGTVSISLNDVDIMTALEAILHANGYVARQRGNFFYVGTPEDFETMAQTADRVATRIYRLNYVKASEMQTLLAPMLTPEIGTVSVSSEADSGIAADDTATGGDAFAQPEMLLVHDYEAVLAQVDQVVDEVDRQPLQVAIEAMILSVRVDDSNSLGVDFELLRNKNAIRLISGAPLASLGAINTDNGGLKIGFLDSSLAMFLDALETVGDTNVIASPQLMCLNKQRAEVLIGSKLGYVQTTVTENAATQSIEFLEVGTQLRLRPFISADGMVRMEIHPELSTGNVRVEGQFTLPDKEVTQVTTNVMCPDGGTIIIGGLFREDLANNTSQIPLFGSLPWVGPFFRQTKETTDRREVIVLLTPRIVCEPQMTAEGQRAAAKFLQHHSVYADKMSPIGKRYYGRRYRRLAHTAWAEGDACTALRYINLSIHFDPMNLEAVQLREEIVAAGGVGDATVDTRLREGLAPWDHPRGPRPLPPWVLQDETAPPAPPNVYPELYDPGEPGFRRDVTKPAHVMQATAITRADDAPRRPGVTRISDAAQVSVFTRITDQGQTPAVLNISDTPKATEP